MTKKKYQVKITVYGYDVATTEEATRMVVEKILQLKLMFRLIFRPTKKNTKVTPISPHKHKKAQEKFRKETHRRTIFITSISPSALESLEKLRVPNTAHLEVATSL